MDKKYFQPEEITSEVISKLSKETVEILYENANNVISSVHDSCLGIIDRCYKLQTWLISFITALIGVLFFQLCSEQKSVILITLAIVGIIGFGAISLHLVINTMFNVHLYNKGSDPSLLVRKEMMEFLSDNIREEDYHKHILGAHLAILQNNIRYNKQENYKLVKAYRIAIIASLSLVGLIPLLFVLLISFL